ncbi:SDR family oxidoreductase [Marivibrio halodurans]|uniref:SDR family oxidoreductase n=1 Tax=Marivibrio halodurans TaxID=2039722 RepID=A0A8J7SPZ2_9PROT|nr:SDR family oxidoreductase [Marivibrio halodurans]MBP5858681.1 SDR family oxidoreductase [Marivibrio halodurans]
MTKTLLILGHGFSAAAFAARLRARGFAIEATCRTPEKAARLEAEGIRAHVLDLGAAPGRPFEGAEAACARATHLLSSIPPGRGEAAVEGGDPALAALGPAIRAGAPYEWIGYLSTTGVYGDRDGGWVDEDSALEPTGARGQRRVDAERAWDTLGDLGPVMRFRLAGIYGPGRSALDTVRKGRARRIVKPGQVFSRIHVEDIAAVLEASVDRPEAGAAYNVCDDEAAPPQDVIAHACDLLGVEPPPEIPFDAAELSDMARSFYRDNKRVRNDRIKRALGVRLAYPTYREGLAAQQAAENESHHPAGRPD